MNKKELKKILDNIVIDLTSHKEEKEPLLSLLSGKLGRYLLIFLHSKKYDKDISEIQNKFTQELAESLDNPTHNFSDGISGIGWMLQLLVNEEIMDDEDIVEVLEQIDEVSYQFAMDSFKENNHDFLYGASGEVLYLLNRTKKNGKTKSYLTQILNNLLECKKVCKEGIYWNESDFMLDEIQKQKQVTINIGIAHGQASKIVIFSKLIEQGVQVVNCKEILRECVRFLLSCKSQYTTRAMFPTTIEDNKGNEASFGWSYGAIGIATALWQAGNILNDNKIKKEAESIFLHYANTKIEETRIYEASLCRGTSGIALMYHNMYINTNNELFKQTAEYWYNETLKLAKHDDGIGGFKFLNNYAENKEDWFYQTNPNLLMGSAGIGLSLLSYLSDSKMKWSECLLLN